MQTLSKIGFRVKMPLLLKCLQRFARHCTYQNADTTSTKYAYISDTRSEKITNKDITCPHLHLPGTHYLSHSDNSVTHQVSLLH
jgi:hypothetical protein